MKPASPDSSEPNLEGHGCMEDAVLRSVRDLDGPALLALANRSVAHVPGAGRQEAWLHNRRHFDSGRGVQLQFVAEHPESGALLGYGCIESDPRGEYRLFLVTTPDRLSGVGELLFERGLAVLGELGAQRVWFTEYAGDEPLLRFARKHGFSEFRRFALAGGTEAMTLLKELTRPRYSKSGKSSGA